MIGRARPFVGGVANPYLFDPFHWTPAYASLPSGHSTTAFAVVVAFGTLWRRARSVLLLYALLVAISRIVVTAHHPTDVLAGAVVGIVGVLMVRRWFALRGLGFSVGTDGVLRQYPGPSARRIKSVARDLLAQ
jgi:undecaprenyl-diphosphatase